MDRIAELSRRAAKRLPLFPDRDAIVECAYWTAKNGWRHLIAVVRLVAGQRIEEKSTPPYLDRRWLQRCRAKRAYRKRWLKERGEAYLKHERKLKKRSRERTGHN